MDGGLLGHDKETNEYHTTEKGRRFIKMYHEVDAIISRENMLTKIMHKKAS